MSALRDRGLEGRIESIAGEETQEFWLAGKFGGGAVMVNYSNKASSTAYWLTGAAELMKLLTSQLR